ncbi:hypothetical protein VEZ01S_05_00420 [Vibrio ezurae NBRC 102218]|uniref:Uncharacterized protein n=1 Tax=Vibrio ezurae NBRC 102218 TaxID=1219080 RepID=U3CBF3_9VIBR|nr:hypothetical protein VEZ01S_05_00420 [Vibrio ezurae NBRC 102218]
MLDLRGALVSINVMVCQTKIAKTIINQGGDYLFAVKYDFSYPEERLTDLDRRSEKVINDKAKYTD